MLVEVNYQRTPVSGDIMYDANGYPLVVADPTANTYANLYNRVQYETLGAATTDDCKAAVQDAIAEYETEQFYFNDIRYWGGYPGSASDLQTKPGQEFYSSTDLPLIGNAPHIRRIMVLAFGNRYPLMLRTQQWIDDQSVSLSWKGLPTDWCWVGNAIRIYPIPSMGFDLILEGTIRFPPLVNDGDFNCWTNRAERLIRTEAKRLVFRHINRDEGQVAAMELEILGNPQTGRQGYLAQLRRETTRRQGGVGKLRASRSWV